MTLIRDYTGGVVLRTLSVFKKRIRKKVPSVVLASSRNLSHRRTNNLVFFLVLKVLQVLQRTRCSRKCFRTTKNIFLSHRLDPWRKELSSIVQLRTWCTLLKSASSFTAADVIFKRETLPSALSKEEQGWKSFRKWAVIWRPANSVQHISKWRAYCDVCTTTVFISDDRYPHEWPPPREFWLQWSSTSKKTSSVRYKIESTISQFLTGEISQQ